MNQLLDGLNDKQHEAVLHGDGPLLLLAGAGSGKTRVLTHRIAYLIAEKGVSPWQILALTFTNKAAGEMRERVDNLVGSGAESIWVSTFHSTCVRILRRYIDRLGYDRSFSIYDADDQKALMKDILKSMNLDPKKYKERTFLNVISRAKDELQNPDDFANEWESDFNYKYNIQAYFEYQKRLKANNALDFDDLIMLTVQLFRENEDVLEYYQNRFRYILVDEYQDTNTAQFELLKLLASRYKNLCVVGDDDQSIYKFRGANIHNILSFEEVFPDSKVIRLEQNYRSTKNILAAAAEVIKNNTMRKEKTLWTTAGDGDPIRYIQYGTDLDEAGGVTEDISRRVREEGAAYSDFAILYRANAQSRTFEEKLVLSGIPYRIVGAINFYARKEIKDLLCYLKTVSNGNDDISVRRILNVPKRGVGQTSIDRVAEYATMQGISFYAALEQADFISGISRGIKGIHEFTALIENLRSRLTPEDIRTPDMDNLTDRETGTDGTAAGNKRTDSEESFGKLEMLLRAIIDQTGYVNELEAEDSPEATSRIENIEALIDKVAQYEKTADIPTLDGLLEEIALVADIDTVDTDTDQVLLMTLHGAKGLEFPYVYMVGMEEGMFPGGSAYYDADEEELEEERRLCYVGITRAKQVLTLTNASRRMRNGEFVSNDPSRFINEIPRYLIRQSGGNGFIGRGRMIFNDNDGFGSDFSSSGYGSGGSYGRTSSYDRAAAKRSTPKNKNNAFADNPYISKGMSLSASSPAGKKASGGNSGKPVMDYEVGDEVTHIKFGTGIVTNIDDKGNDAIVSVDFEDFGTRKLMASFANLTKV